MAIRFAITMLGVFKFMLCVCAGCGIMYAIKHGGKGVTHGLCPHCADKMKQDIAAIKEVKERRQGK